MLDLVLFLFCLGILALGLRRPFIWVLAYIYIDIVAPQKIGWTLMPAIPVSLIAFGAAFLGWLLLDSKKGSRFTVSQGIMLALLLYCGWTTMNAQFPEAALEKWDWVWKALTFAIFMPLTLRTRLRVEVVSIFMVLSIAAIVIAGGMKTIFSGGGGYGTLVSLVTENAGIYEGSTMSMVAISSIPLIIWVARYNTIFPKHWTVWAFAIALVFACLLIPVGTQTRTGLLCIGVLGVLVLRHAKHRFLIGAVAGFAMLVAIPFLPASYLERMSTITSHEQDQSASTRVAVWEWTIDYAKERPTGGGFNAFLGNKFTYKTRKEVKEGNTITIESDEVTEEKRAYHSAYFEMLGEQGYPGLIMWLMIHAIGLWSMEMVRRQLRKSEDTVDKSFAALATALQQGHIVFLVGALFIGIAFQPYVFKLIALQIALASMVKMRRERVRAVERKARMKAKRETLRPQDKPAGEPPLQGAPA